MQLRLCLAYWIRGQGSNPKVVGSNPVLVIFSKYFVLHFHNYFNSWFISNLTPPRPEPPTSFCIFTITSVHIQPELSLTLTFFIFTITSILGLHQTGTPSPTDRTTPPPDFLFAFSQLLTSIVGSHPPNPPTGPLPPTGPPPLPDRTSPVPTFAFSQ